MPDIAVPSRFVRDSATRPLGGGRHEATIDRAWWIERGPNGGYLAAIILRAIQAEVADPDRAPRTFTVHYLAPPQEGPVEIAVVVERSGRSLSTVSARVEQDGRLVALALAALATSRAVEGFDDLVAPDDLAAGPGLLELPEVAPIPLAEQFRTRQTVGGARFEVGDRAEVGGWIQLDDPTPLDAPVVAALTDAWYPAIFNRLRVMVAVPTIELTVHFRHAVPAEAADEPCFVRFRSRAAIDGYLEEDGEVWSAGGLLLAQSSQLAAFIPMG